MLLGTATKDDWWVYLLYALITSGGLAGLFTGVSKVVASWKRSKGVEELGKTFSAMAELNSALNDLRAQTDACRAVILKSTNGGGIPSPGKGAYSSVVFESYNNAADRIRHLWQDIPVDSQYSQLLNDVYQQGTVRIETKQLPPGDLKDLYDASGVQKSVVCRIGCNELAMFYLSVNFKNPKHLTSGELSIIRAAVAHMAALFKRSKEIYFYDFNSPV